MFPERPAPRFLHRAAVHAFSPATSRREDVLSAGLPALARTIDEEPIVVHAHDVTADVIVAIALFLGRRRCRRSPGPGRRPGTHRRDVATPLALLLLRSLFLLGSLFLWRQRLLLLLLLLLIGAHTTVQVLLEGVEVAHGRRRRRLLNHLVWMRIVKRLRLQGSSWMRGPAPLRRRRGEHSIWVEDFGDQQAHPARGLVTEAAVDEVAPA